MTYQGLSLALVAVAALVGFWGATRVPSGQARRRHWAAVALSAAVLVVLTAIFDNVIIGVGVSDYDVSKTSGVRVGLAPIEDFSYSIAAALALPGMWVLLRRTKASPDE